MRRAAAILWVLLVAGGGWRIAHRPKPPAPAPSPMGGCLSGQQKKAMPHWTAVRAIPLNWRVRARDLAAPGQGQPPDSAKLAGKYASCPILAGDPVVENDVVDLPTIPVVAGKSLFPVPLTTNESESLNAGGVVTLSEGSRELVGAGDVAWVDCRNGCLAWLQLGPAERQLLESADPPKLTLVVRQTGGK